MLLTTVKNIYDTLNEKNFGGVLERPIIKFNRSKTHHAFYNGSTMQFNLTDVKGFAAVTELVFHEMVHQYVDEILNFKKIEDHGHEFKQEYSKFSGNVIIDVDYMV